MDVSTIPPSNGTRPTSETVRLPIGEFSRMTYLSVKALRHYHDVGLLEPAAVDPSTGYRSYTASQVPLAHAIRRFRDLDMPLDEVRAVVRADDPIERSEAIVSHLERLERRLAETQAMVTSLRAVLEGAKVGMSVELRHAPAASVLAVRGVVRCCPEAERWLHGAFREIYRALRDPDVTRVGPDSAIFSDDFFENGEGEVVAYVPTTGALQPRERVYPTVVPDADLVIAVHRGPFTNLDQTYAALGTYVAEQGMRAGGPVRELYLISGVVTPDPDDYLTEVCWPVSRTRVEG
jgi:DNA-binding transcriptional MerR regulator/effector-binding domain-containing protein